jgi:GT2 family glycosyltransferase
LESIASQTIFSQLEVIVADNRSQDGSDEIAASMLAGWGNGILIQHGANLGFCEGNNRAAGSARGKYLFFLNNDTWLEPDCLEKLLQGAKRHQPGAATPLVLNYEDSSVQLVFGVTYDIFGLPAFAQRKPEFCEIFMPPGCS